MVDRRRGWAVRWPHCCHSSLTFSKPLTASFLYGTRQNSNNAPSYCPQPLTSFHPFSVLIYWMFCLFLKELGSFLPPTMNLTTVVKIDPGPPESVVRKLSLTRKGVNNKQDNMQVTVFETPSRISHQEDNLLPDWPDILVNMFITSSRGLFSSHANQPVSFSSFTFRNSCSSQHRILITKIAKNYGELRLYLTYELTQQAAAVSWIRT